MHRSNTTNQSVFELPGSARVTFDFSCHNHIRVTVPKGSTWRTEYHWHDHGAICERLDVIHGCLQVSYSDAFSGGVSSMSKGCCYTFRKGDGISWSSQEREEDLVIILAANQTIYRHKCSAILDTDRFPFLASTPMWLKAIFRTLAPWPSAYDWLLMQMLWVQLQAMNYAHGYYTIHGQLPLRNIWRILHPIAIFGAPPPPRRLVRLQWQSRNVFSSITESACFWIGKGLGIQGQYPEYTPRMEGERVERETKLKEKA